MRAVGRLLLDPPRQFRRADAGLGLALGAQRLERLDGGELGVGTQMQIAGFHAVRQAERMDVDLHHLGLRIHVAAVDGVIVEARPEGDHEIGLRAELARDFAGVAAGDADRERVVVEHAARRQRRCEQRASGIGQLFDLGRRTGAHRAAAGDDDRTFGAGELVGQLLDLMRMRIERLGFRHHLGRRLIIAEVRQRLLLQIVWHADDHGLSRLARGVERLADVLVHALRAVRGNVMRAGRGGERRLLDILVVPFGIDRRLRRRTPPSGCGPAPRPPAPS